jgi:hypothetical protein
MEFASSNLGTRVYMTPLAVVITRGLFNAFNDVQLNCKEFMETFQYESKNLEAYLVNLQ